MRWVAPFDSIDKRDLALVGGKGANLGEMTRAGFPVAGGFCVTTDAFGSGGDISEFVHPTSAKRMREKIGRGGK